MYTHAQAIQALSVRESGVVTINKLILESTQNLLLTSMRNILKIFATYIAINFVQRQSKKAN